jgi:hypothetical protein
VCPWSSEAKVRRPKNPWNTKRLHILGEARLVAVIRAIDEVTPEHDPDGADRDDRVTLRVAETETPSPAPDRLDLTIGRQAEVIGGHRLGAAVRIARLDVPRAETTRGLVRRSSGSMSNPRDMVQPDEIALRVSCRTS